MRKLFIVSQVFLSVLGVVVAQSSWNDSFSNGDFITSKLWMGDTSYFIINNSQQLQLQAPGAGHAALATESEISRNASWEWWQQMSFNPSSANFSAVHFMMDVADPRIPHNGYFLRIGGTTERRLHLFRMDGGTATLVAESAANLVNSNLVTLRIKITRDSLGTFSVFVDDQGGQQFQLVATATDTTHIFSSHFGLYCQYTATRADRFFFDDFQVSGLATTDTLPPKVTSYKISEENKLTLNFNKALSGPSPTSFLRNQIQPDSVKLLLPTVVELTFSSPFVSQQTYSFRIQNLSDLRGNMLVDTSWQSIYYRADWNSLVFNEVMANPTPVVQLPDAEYIELFNRSTFPIDVENWQLHIGNQIRSLPSILLPPNQFLLIYSNNHPKLFPDSVPQIQLSLSNTVLTNSGQVLRLFSASGVLVDSLRYSDQWYGHPDKRSGGWSLERIDPDRQCGEQENWSASTSPLGGTPGTPNAIYAYNPDTVAPFVIGHGLMDEHSIWLQFNERVFPNPQLPHPYFLNAFPEIDSISMADDIPNALQLFMKTPLQNQHVYALILPPYFQDCHGILNNQDTLYFGIPEFPDVGDVILNEVLFHPPAGGVRFVELLNVSNKIIDLGQLRLCHVDDITKMPINTRSITTGGRLLFPGAFAVITPNSELLLAQHPNTVVEALHDATLPSMTNSSGSIGIATVSLTLLDYLNYDATMHHVAIRNPAGVSLERIRPSGPANDPFNWTSAAASAGFATPGFQNSQRNGAYQTQRRFEIHGTPFSPNGDGYRDLLEIHFQFEKSGYVLQGRIFDTQGREVSHFANTVLVGETGVIHWNGETGTGKIAPIGTYIVLIDATHPEGDRHQFKG
ncbi:MAG: lamin tail domain-containing protein, partial [Schleiferiaceae bacterium]|nr:lamin tail domain-containing protein [Schleiferiaceae bacterium]